jgi:hypothetical protein
MFGSIHCDLDLNGELTIDVDGPVSANDPPVPPSRRGTNPVPFFAAIVRCTTAANGVIATDNVATANVLATIPGGDA